MSSIQQTFFAEDLGQEQHREAVTVGVARIALRISDQSVLAALTDDEVSGTRNLAGIGPLCGGGTVADHRCTGQGRHRCRIDLCVPLTA